MTDDNDIDHLDTLIDDVAQTMTSAPAGDDFARRVSTRIAESGERRQSWLRPWVLVPLAAAIVLFVLVRLKPDPTVLGRPDASPVVTNETVRPKPDTTDDVRLKDVRLKKDATYTAATDTAGAPLARIEPAALAPIEIDPIAIEPLVETNAVQITPIAIDRIEIFPMP